MSDSNSNKGGSGKQGQAPPLAIPRAKPPAPPRPPMKGKAGLPEGPQGRPIPEADEKTAIAAGFPLIPVPEGAHVKGDSIVDSSPCIEAESDSTTNPYSPAQPAPLVAADAIEAMLPVRFAAHGYLYIAKIGQGGMGNVYVAREETLDRDVAIKVLNADMFGNEMARARFGKEARALAKLNHPNITTIYRLIEDKKEGASFIVQELLKGMDMNDIRVRKGSLDFDEFQKLFMQACEGFEAAHEAGIIHRDIKPENLFVVGTNGRRTVKIMDFGIAKVEDAKTGKSFRTQVGFCMGTVDYMSPEQAAGKEVDHRADIYSLGATMYEMITGVTPFDAGRQCTPAEYQILVMPKILNDKPEMPSARVPLKGIPPALDALIMRCLEKDPEDRYQSMDDLKSALMRLEFKPASTPAPAPFPFTAAADELGPIDPLAPTAGFGVASAKAPSRPPSAPEASIIVAPELRGVIVDGKSRSAIAIEAGVVKPLPISEASSAVANGQSAEQGDVQKGKPTIITKIRDEKERTRARRKSVKAVAAVASAVLVLGTATVFALHYSGRNPASIETAQPGTDTAGNRTEGRTSAPADSVGDLVPLVPVTADAGAAQATADAAESGQEARTYTITIRTSPMGVEVFDGQNNLCTTSPNEQCRVSFTGSAEQVLLRFHKRGYADVERPVVPDSDQTLDVSLEPARPRPGVTRPPTKQGTRPGTTPGPTGPSITSEE